MSDFFSVLQKRYSVRGFSSLPIEQEKIEKLKDALLLAPSGRAIYPCEFYFVKDASIRHELSNAKPRGGLFLKDSPLAIVIAADGSSTDIWVEDASIAATYAFLQVVNLDLGACWVHIRNRKHESGSSSEEYVKNVLNIPDHYRVLCIIAVGYPSSLRYGSESVNTSIFHDIG